MRLYNVLIVDDESYIVNSVTTLLECQQEWNLDVHSASSGEEAIGILRSMRIDILISDICMPGMDGITLIREARALWPDCFALLLTAYADFSLAYRAIHTDVDGYILKTEPDERLLEEIGRAINRIDEMHDRLDGDLPKDAYEPRELNSRLLEQLICYPSGSNRSRIVLDLVGASDKPLWLIAIHASDLTRHIFPLEWLVRTESARLAEVKASCLQGECMFMLLEAKSNASAFLGCLELVQERYRAAFSSNLSIVVSALQPQDPDIPSAAQQIRGFLSAVDGKMNDYIHLMPVPGEQEDRDSHKLFESTVSYIQHHLTEDLSLTTLSTVAGYSPSYLSHLFYEKTGEHISAFIARRKIELLNSIMQDQSLSLNEIAEKMGFSSRSYFNRYVKRTTGETPQKMRDRLTRDR